MQSSRLESFLLFLTSLKLKNLRGGKLAFIEHFLCAGIGLTSIFEQRET